MTFIDIHSHLEMLKDLDKVITNAKKASVNIILTNGVNAKTNRQALEFSQKYVEVKSCLGIYPSDGLKLTDQEIDKEIEFIKQNKDKIIAIGEVGLDMQESKDLDQKKKNL